jgi:hypothetical protein
MWIKTRNVNVQSDRLAQARVCLVLTPGKHALKTLRPALNHLPSYMSFHFISPLHACIVYPPITLHKTLSIYV